MTATVAGPSPWLRPVTLEGDGLRLEPMTPDHVSELWAVGRDAGLWTYLPGRMASESDAARVVRRSLDHAARGAGVGFVQRVLPESEVAGATGFWNADPLHRRVEIGFTWLAAPWQGTRVNPAAKLLLLRHAFETLGCLRVEFKTDARNARSRAALRKLGAVEEGTLRRHMVMPDGAYRDSVYYSILDDEWPAVRAGLEERLGGGTEGGADAEKA